MSHPVSAHSDLRADRRRRLGVALLLALVTFAVFLPALDAEFLDWDDDVNLVQNTGYRGLTLGHLRWMATATVMGHYIPVTWLSFGIDHALWGMNPRGYHLTNVLLHVGAALAFFGVALRLLRRATSAPAGATLAGATVAALFFAIHPLRAESVAWVTERRDVLSGLFFLLTVLAYLAAHEQSTDRRRRLLLAASLGAYAAAMFSKAIVMGLPLVLLVLDAYPLRRLDLRDWRRARGVLLEKLPYAAVAALGAGAAFYVVKTFTALTTLEAFPWPGRVAMIFYSFWFYVTRTVVPMALSPLYELPPHVSLAQPRFLVPALAVIAATAVLVAVRRRWPAGLAVWICYLVLLAPVAGVVHAGFQLAHDRYSYHSCLGWAVLLGAGVTALAQPLRLVTRPLRQLALGVTAAWLLALGWLTWQQVHVWRDSYSLWTYAVDADPTCALCHGNLAAHLTNDGDLGHAVHHATVALTLRPDRVRPHLTMGIALTKANRLDEAIPHFATFLAERPQSVDGLVGLGVALLRAGRPRDAIVPLYRALTINPDHVIARVNYASVLVNLGQREAAVAEYRIALSVEPGSREARYGVGWALARFGDTEGARREQAILQTLDAGLAARLERDIMAAR
ncbi:MAG: tetratricopeptide repeat protein [Candidatus Rokubacteria bacterium]|nr:tetratricopeptide repeat protein [Candidatus Rokubacteria bacterium]